MDHTTVARWNQEIESMVQRYENNAREVRALLPTVIDALGQLYQAGIDYHYPAYGYSGTGYWTIPLDRREDLPKLRSLFGQLRKVSVCAIRDDMILVSVNTERYGNLIRFSYHRPFTSRNGRCRILSETKSYTDHTLVCQ